MTTDPKDAGIARYDLDLMESRMVKDQWGGEWVRHSDHATEIARLTAEAEAVKVARDMLGHKWAKAEAERDAALAQVAEQKAVLSEILEWSHRQFGLYPDWQDRLRKVLGQFDGDAGMPERDRRDAQMRAEGLRRALDVISENADWPEDEHGRTEHPALFARISHAILAAAEKEASNG